MFAETMRGEDRPYDLSPLIVSVSILRPTAQDPRANINFDKRVYEE
jgi:hypothetical protein